MVCASQLQTTYMIVLELLKWCHFLDILSLTLSLHFTKFRDTTESELMFIHKNYIFAMEIYLKLLNHFLYSLEHGPSDPQIMEAIFIWSVLLVWKLFLHHKLFHSSSQLSGELLTFLETTVLSITKHICCREDMLLHWNIGHRANDLSSDMSLYITGVVMTTAEQSCLFSSRGMTKGLCLIDEHARNPQSLSNRKHKCHPTQSIPTHRTFYLNGTLLIHRANFWFCKRFALHSQSSSADHRWVQKQWREEQRSCSQPLPLCDTGAFTDFPHLGVRAPTVPLDSQWNYSSF